MSGNGLSLWQATTGVWATFAMYFYVAARRLQVKRATPLALASGENTLALMATLLVFFPRLYPGSLVWHMGTGRGVQLAGFCVTVLGLGFAAWSRDILGRSWSARAVIQVDHRLIIAGPYAYLRHPLYTGILLALAGTVIAESAYPALLGWILAAAYFRTKARREEMLLEAEFGSEYAQYRACTGFLLPKVVMSSAKPYASRGDTR